MIFQQRRTTMKAMLVCLMMMAGAAQAATVELKPPSPAYPILLGASCGYVVVSTYATGFDLNGNILGEIYAWTSCSTGGRGTRPKRIGRWTSIVWDTAGNQLALNAWDGIVGSSAFAETNEAGVSIWNEWVCCYKPSVYSYDRAYVNTP
jgi:hypothetical protein